MNINLIHKENPYEGFGFENYSLDLQGWGSTDPNFKKLIDEINPRLIIEVGSWKGGSAIFMAEYIKKKNLDCKILCVDTWLGAVEFWADQHDEERYISLGMKNGYPSVYYQFLANVMHKGLQDIIIPFPQTSILAARFLALNNIKADLIYIDASHDEKDVYDDINNYWPILNTGGKLFGDDYDEFWPGVKLAVNNFVLDNGLDIKFTERQWAIKKEKEEINTDSDNIYIKARENKILALTYERELFINRAELHHIKISVIPELENKLEFIDRENKRLKRETDDFLNERDAYLSEREAFIHERYSYLSERETFINERDAYAIERNNHIELNKRLEENINLLLNSRSWKVTSIFRYIKKVTIGKFK